MKKIRSDKLKDFYHFYPTVVSVCLVKTEEKLNGLSIAWNTAISFSPPLVGLLISPKRFSYKLIESAGEFTSNFLPYDKAEIIAILGRTSGRDIDKFEEFGIQTEPPLKIKTPVLKDAYASYECKLQDVFKCGDHSLFIGEVVAVHYIQEYFEERGLPLIDKFSPALYLGKDTYLRAVSWEKRTLDKNFVEELRIKCKK